MAGRVAGALRAAGIGEVLAVGGDRVGLEALGLRWVPDRWPGEGPLGGVLSGLRATRGTAASDDPPHPAEVLVCACDLPDLSAVALRLVLDAAVRSPAADVVLPVVAGRRQPLAAVYRPGAHHRLTVAWEAGERSIQRALESLVVADVEVPAELAGAFHDRDTAV